ncbi:LLM class flavin-dependent oxidoreductase [Salinimonas chungwhensis]|uniref:LLM class flavin-dependent oxidoreductase n=1 Tax=Salinimonas chungwhensis TaxID=265425 RepID=UPI00035D5AEB|nr:LLM class flavin-dependent oxidoreductase [Salinimonas chungwhensis]
MSIPVPFSILDLAHIGDNQSVQQAMAKSQAIAALAENSGYERLWLAEHHGMRGVASAATSTLLANLGAITSKIRLGAGGVMLPNHSPLVVAEQYGTLDALYPGRIDLGLGRAPGTDQKTSKALRRDLHSNVSDYPADIQLLQHYFSNDSGDAQVLAVPGAGSHVPLYLLGSSLYSAQLAGQLGLPFTFASHFAPEALFDAINIYKTNFRPSDQLDKPYIIAGVMAVVADTEEQAAYHFSSVQQQFANLRRGANAPMPAPVEDIYAHLSEAEVQTINRTLRYAVNGTPDKVESQLQNFVESTGVDELILSFPIYDDNQCLAAIQKVGDMTSVKAPASWQA